jgi:hypothetical protein
VSSTGASARDKARKGKKLTYTFQIATKELARNATVYTHLYQTSPSTQTCWLRIQCSLDYFCFPSTSPNPHFVGVALQHTAATMTYSPLPALPRTRPGEFGNAALQWARSRRGRVFVLAAVLILIILALGGAKNAEVCCHTN